MKPSYDPAKPWSRRRREFGASAEHVFGTLVQRTLSRPLWARYHYGHPDMMDKLAMVAQGGFRNRRQCLSTTDCKGCLAHGAMLERRAPFDQSGAEGIPVRVRGRGAGDKREAPSPAHVSE